MYKSFCFWLFVSWKQKFFVLLAGSPTFAGLSSKCTFGDYHLVSEISKIVIKRKFLYSCTKINGCILLLRA